MSFSSGTFSLVAGNPVVTGTTISSTVQNNTMNDVATGLSTCLLKDGTQAATAIVPFVLGINSTLGTDATSSTTGSIITAGGIGSAKAINSGSTIQSATPKDSITAGIAQFKSGAWTPVASNITIVGNATYTGSYTRIGNRVFCTLLVDSTTSTASTANSTYFTGIPYPVTTSGTVTACATDITNGGVSVAYAGDGNVYMPTWAAKQHIVVQFSYETTAVF